MPENTLSIAADSETMHSRELQLHFFHPSYPSQVPPLHCGPVHASRTSNLHPASSLWHAPTSRQCILRVVGIEVHHYCSPSLVGLDIDMPRLAHKNNVYGQLIKRNTLTNEQYYIDPAQGNQGGRACVTCTTRQAKFFHVHVGEESMVLRRPIHASDYW